MDTLALTVAAVLLSLLVAIPLGIWAGLSDRVDPGRDAGARPHADDADVRLPGAADAVLPDRPGLGDDRDPDLRGAAGDPAHRARDPLGAAGERRGGRSLGSTRGQTLLKVLLPMSKRTVVVGINQTIMAALSMVTVAALIDAPGLGETVLKALQTLDVGVAFNAGLAIVVIAIVLDRVTTAAGDRPWRTGESCGGKVLLGAGARRQCWSRSGSPAPTCGRPSSPSDVNVGSRIAVDRGRRDRLGAGQPSAGSPTASGTRSPSGC